MEIELNTETRDRIEETVDTIVEEIALAMVKAPKLNSPHEAYAVIKEALEDYWDEAKMATPNKKDQRSELITVAARAIRAVVETT